jgi:transcriptional regulator with XRE-family HTH domain
MDITYGEGYDDMQIQKYRRESKKTQKELAYAVGITQGYLSELESGGKRNPSLNLLQKIATELGTTVDALLSMEKAG